MNLRRRPSSAVRWSFLGAAVLAAAAGVIAWALFLRDDNGSLSDEDFREVEAFEEYERRKRKKA